VNDIGYDYDQDIAYLFISCNLLGVGSVIKHEIRTKKTLQSDFYPDIPENVFARKGSVFYFTGGKRLGNSSLVELDAQTLKQKKTTSILRSLGDPSVPIIYDSKAELLVYKTYKELHSNLITIDMSQYETGDLHKIVKSNVPVMFKFSGAHFNPFDVTHLVALHQDKDGQLFLMDIELSTGLVYKNLTIVPSEAFKGANGYQPSVIDRDRGEYNVFVEERGSGKMYIVTIELKSWRQIRSVLTNDISGYFFSVFQRK
jgi:hypothetical protein